jgi:hypothetical protein
MTKNPEDAINQVLAGLRDAEPPAGMQRRIIEGVHHRTATKPTRAPWKIWGTATACALVLCIVISATHHQHLPSQSPTPSTHTAATRTPTTETNEITRPLPLITPSKTQQHTHKPNLVTVTDSTTLRDIHAQSHPAPPEPLTHEEKLLLRVAHTGNAQLLATLDPTIRAAQAADEKADFEKFFRPSTTGEKE